MATEKNEYNLIIEDGIFKHTQHLDNVMCTQNGAESLHEVFVKSVQSNYNRSFLGTIANNTVKYITYLEAYNKTKKICSFMRKHCVPGEEIVGIFSVNREEWILSEQAILMMDAISCPLYSTLGIDSIVHIINETGMKFLFVSGDKTEYLYEKIIGRCPNRLKHIVCYDHVENHVVDRFKELGIYVHFLDEIYRQAREDDISLDKIVHLKDGKDAVDEERVYVQENVRNYSKSNPDDVVCICYTSGTCGTPKGAMLTNRNFIATIAAFSRGENMESVIEISDSVVYISYLPLAHAMEKICVCVIISVGARIGFYSGNPKNLQQDIKIIKPSFLVGVPRVFNVFRDRIMEKVNERNFMVRLVFKLALWYKKQKQAYGSYSSYLVDKFVFRKIATEFGGNIRFGLSGSAPLNPEVCSFLQAVFSMKLYEGYGQTEALAANILKPPKCYIHGTVGVPFPSNMVKLVPSDISGHCEILLKGDNVFKGYYKNPKKTAEVLDADGWLHTGDLGVVRNNLFYIVGRKKEIFKTSLGEYIVPEKLESLYKQGPIDDVFITGKPSGDHIVAIVVSKDKSITKEEIKEKILEIGQMAYSKGKITKFEIPHDVFVTRDEFTMADGLITPTGKKRRLIIEEKYKNEIELMYK